MEVKEIEDHKFDDLVVELEKEIENLEKQKAAAKLKLEVLEAKEIAEPGDDEKILNLKAELELLSGLVVEREEKIKALNDEVKRREDIKLKIDELIGLVDFEEEETHKRWDREAEAEVEYKVVLVHKFLHNLKFCDHIKYKEEIEDHEGKVVEVEKEKKVFWNKAFDHQTRILVQFSTDEITTISKSIADHSSTNASYLTDGAIQPKYFLRLYEAEGNSQMSTE